MEYNLRKLKSLNKQAQERKISYHTWDFDFLTNIHQTHRRKVVNSPARLWRRGKKGSKLSMLDCGEEAKE